jgi:thioredoxin-related protein
LIYYAEDVYKTTSFKDFLPLYFKTYPPGVPQVMTILHIHWIPIDEIDQRMKQNPKKIFIDVYNRYKITPTIMRIQVYNNPIIAQYLNTHFYPTTVEAKWGDTIVFHGYKFGPSSKYPYHTLAIDLLNGHMIFPAFVVFDKKYELIAIRHGFYTPEEFYKFITYIGGDYYKKEKYSQYLKEHKAELDEKIKQIKKYYSHVKY